MFFGSTGDYFNGRSFAWAFTPLLGVYRVNQNDFRSTGERDHLLITKVNWTQQF